MYKRGLAFGWILQRSGVSMRTRGGSHNNGTSPSRYYVLVLGFSVTIIETGIYRYFKKKNIYIQF